MSGRLRVISTLAVRGVFQTLEAERPEVLSGADVDFAPTAVLLRRLAAGERADVGILTGEAVANLVGDGTMLAGSRVDLALSPIGLAVRAGAPHPTIDTLDDFVRTLREASSLVYSRAGASGIFFADLIDRIGLAEEVNAKAIVIPSGFTAELVARGEVEMAIQQVSELLVVPGIEVVGRLPEGAQQISTFSAGILMHTSETEAARSLLARLADPGLAAIFEANGLLPVAHGEG